MTAAEARAAGWGNSPKASIPAPPQNAKQSAAVVVPSPVEVPAESKKPLQVHVSTYDFQDGCDRVVFPKIPREQTNAFIHHCQQFKP